MEAGTLLLEVETKIVVSRVWEDCKKERRGREDGKRGMGTSLLSFLAFTQVHVFVFKLLDYMYLISFFNN